MIVHGSITIASVPEEYRGRIFGIVRGMSVVLIPISVLVGGWIAEFVEIWSMFAFAGAYVLGVALLAWANPHVRGARIQGLPNLEAAWALAGAPTSERILQRFPRESMPHPTAAPRRADSRSLHAPKQAPPPARPALPATQSLPPSRPPAVSPRRIPTPHASTRPRRAGA